MITAIVPVLNGVAVQIKSKWYEIDIPTLQSIINSNKNLVIDGKTVRLMQSER